MFKGTLMQIWKSANIFLFMWNQYVEDLTLRQLLIFEIYMGEICKKFFYEKKLSNSFIKAWLKISLWKPSQSFIKASLTKPL